MTYDAFKRQYALTPTAQQETAIRSAEGYILLLAVPGSGKTTVLVQRLGYLILCRGVDPKRILTMTYTVSAAADMKGRFAALFGADLAGEMTFRTINGLCASIINHYIRTCQRPAPFTLLSDEGEAAAIIREAYQAVTHDFPTDSDIKSLQSAITYAKNQMLDEDGIAALEKDVEHFAAIYHRYKETLRSRRLMDYDDQMVYAWNILRRCPEIRSHFQSRWQYLCVDEAQDTSRIQHLIIALLAEKNGNLFMVGDEDQSIYGFRAAYPEALLHFEQDHPGAKVLLMEENFRSTPQIVAAANRFIGANQHRRPKHMRAVRPDGSEVRPIFVYDRRGQYRYLLQTARECSRETAVLYRDNDCALPLMDLLERNGIPYRCRQMDFGFFSHRITRDLTDILRLSLDPGDKEAFMRVYYKFSAGISRQAAEYAARHCRGGESLFLCIAQTEGVSDWTRMKCKALHTHLVNMRTESGDKAVYRILHFMGYGEYLSQRNADPHRAAILEALGEQEPSPERLLARLEELQELLQNRRDDPDCPFILSTIHSSKGLEYERVFLMDVADGILPKENSDLEEERRLFYVGMTRAKEDLAVFTFRKEALTSAFADSLFPPAPREAPKAASIRPMPRAASARRAAPESKKPLPPMEDFVPRRSVIHRKFGSGVILQRQEDILRIRFVDGEIRRLSLTTALQSGALKLE